MEQVIIRITGKVQGVFFRAEAKKRADAWNIKGYAKNLSDGSVEVCAQGEPDAVRKLIEVVPARPGAGTCCGYTCEATRNGCTG
ncbi:acylphosphatase [Candidatus Peregrinibacteria bacterium CG11_big_fil_rev_8_21_14_0_20_46_8]|nr:MAG: acylphosphatase [Candidatus Peregrinibacteria bacterium CG11_big_fil_rev_8_21_14_0_20_46_8]